MAQTKRLKRRMAGMLNARLPEARLDKLSDPRSTRGRRWRLGPLLRAALVGIMAGCRSLAAVEALTADMSRAVRRLLGITRRVPDTTLRDLLVQIQPSKLRQNLRQQIRAAHRRKALPPVGLPFGQVAIDGKVTKVKATSGRHVQVPEKKGYGLVRTSTCCLVSARARPCIEMVPIPHDTNEMGHFEVVLKSLDREFGRMNMFFLVSGDAGVCSLANASLTRQLRYHYLFALKDNQPELIAETTRLLASLEPRQAKAETEDVVGRTLVFRRVYHTPELAGYLKWDHLQTVLRVEREVVDRDTGEIRSTESRYFVSSLASSQLTDKQWLLVVRNHWGIENNCHQTWDYSFEEDDRPWITQDAQGTLVVMILRRIAYNMLALFRSVTQRSNERRHTPWRTLVRWMYNMIIAASGGDVAGLRPRAAVAFKG